MLFDKLNITFVAVLVKQCNAIIYSMHITSNQMIYY